VRFGRPNVTVNESGGEFTMCVVKDRETAVPVTVNIVTRPGTATEGIGECVSSEVHIYFFSLPT
jgi:hypothetical protein